MLRARNPLTGEETPRSGRGEPALARTEPYSGSVPVKLTGKVGAFDEGAQVEEFHLARMHSLQHKRKSMQESIEAIEVQAANRELLVRSQMAKNLSETRPSHKDVMHLPSSKLVRESTHSINPELDRDLQSQLRQLRGQI